MPNKTRMIKNILVTITLCAVAYMSGSLIQSYVKNEEIVCDNPLVSSTETDIESSVDSSVPSEYITNPEEEMQRYVSSALETSEKTETDFQNKEDTELETSTNTESEITRSETDLTSGTYPSLKSRKVFSKNYATTINNINVIVEKGCDYDAYLEYKSILEDTPDYFSEIIDDITITSDNLAVRFGFAQAESIQIAGLSNGHNVYFSDIAPDKYETVYHEAGHCVDRRLGWASDSEDVLTLYNSENKILGLRTTNNYDVHEFFASSYDYYSRDPVNFEKNMPKTYSYFSDILEENNMTE